MSLILLVLKQEAESYENKAGGNAGDDDDNDVYIPESSPQADCVVTSTTGDTDLGDVASNSCDKQQQQQQQQQQQDAEISDADNSAVASSTSLEKQDEVDTSSEMASLSSPVQQQHDSSPTQSGGIIM